MAKPPEPPKPQNRGCAIAALALGAGWALFLLLSLDGWAWQLA